MDSFVGEFIRELKQAGYDYEDVNDIFRQKSLEPFVVETILKWLPQLYGSITVRLICTPAGRYKMFLYNDNDLIVSYLFSDSILLDRTIGK
jgi:hypothetical protein